jgi:hypothetical protein
MKVTSFLVQAFLFCTVSASPLPEAEGSLQARQSDRGSYTVSGLGSRKQQVLNAGGNTLDLAIAMLETDRMSTDYAYGRLTFQQTLHFSSRTEDEWL